MLSHLSIQNYALIESLSTTFENGLTVITGETGSGKSIILGALGLVLGERVEGKVLRNPESKCIIEGTFHIPKPIPFFIENDLDHEEYTIIRREITPSGKSRGFINDTPASLQTMKQLGSWLVDIHSQDDQGAFAKPSFRAQILDVVGKSSELSQQYQMAFSELSDKRKNLNALKEKAANLSREEDYLKFQLSEMEEADLSKVKLDELEEKRDVLEHAEEIQTSMDQLRGIVQDDNGILDAIRSAIQSIKGVTDKHTGIADLNDRLQSSLIELEDIGNEAEQLLENSELNPGELDEILKKLDHVYKLFGKHQLDSIQSLMALEEDMAMKLQSIGNFEDEILQLENAIEEANKKVQDIGAELHEVRSKSAKKLEKQIEALIQPMGMEHAAIRFDFKELQEPNSIGLYGIDISFKANKGSDFAPLTRVASGGERSRLSLALKSMLSESKLYRTMILDEIDTGVSGEMALRMAKLMKQMGKNAQTISISHLPQVAGKANHHLKVFKTSDNQSTSTHLKPLHGQERIHELAEMLGGKAYGEEAIANATVLLEKQ